DPYRSNQKGMIEKNHEFIRMILPKGHSFDNLSQYDATRIANHINSYPREALNGNTPYSLAKMLIGKDFLEKMNCKKIPADLVTLRPSLLYQSPEEE
ncbi:MAG: IS30 family transposase, partial [Lachnospiraceae bacterium]|nr:IS30 family transposase [Lachnospiraceae bacterium]